MPTWTGVCFLRKCLDGAVVVGFSRWPVNGGRKQRIGRLEEDGEWGDVVLMNWSERELVTRLVPIGHLGGGVAGVDEEEFKKR